MNQLVRRLKKNSKKKIHLIAYSSPQSPITEQYRLIRSNIHFSSGDKEIKSIVITSPKTSDGKTTTASNLAIVLAQKGKRVLLVDADLRKPSVHYAFNISNIQGLTNVLEKKIPLNQAISKTPISNLTILTSGNIPTAPSELLDSKAMELIMEEMKEMYDYVLFDTPSVLEVTDAQIIANKSDGIVMVVASAKTPKEEAVKAKNLLIKTKAQLLGIVVNELKSTQSRYYY
ncbi:CpsD/CapB family tyrosine-protein kinase [Peribacillus asahii]|uniref:CpsD/CapB family tyrosine-protein kinase n=1 Tax=Peribacillus asahii TaxID=228899 RepID=UPI0037FCF064